LAGWAWCPARTSAKKRRLEAVHGSAPTLRHGNREPTALLQSAILMLRHLDERAAADKIETAMLKVFEEGQVRTATLRHVVD